MTESLHVGFTFDMKKLEAIEKIPGNGIHQKMSWIANEIKAQVSPGFSLKTITESEKFPKNNPYLKEMIKIETAKIVHKLGHENREQYLAIAEALQSENQDIVTRALRATEFFDGTNREFTNVEYFFKSLLKNVSLKTQNQIIQKLARCLKNTTLGDEFFKETEATFGIARAKVLLAACTEPFIMETITKHRLVLSSRELNVLSQKYPTLMIWYLKLSDPSLYDPQKRFNHQVYIHSYLTFLVRLIKTNFQAFTEIYELHGVNAPHLYLNKKQGKLFAQIAREYYLDKPKIYFKLLRDEHQYEKDLEIMFPKMLPDSIDKCTVNDMFSLLKNYPKEKTVSLMLKSYENAYGKSLLDDVDKVSERLMRLLPAENRIRLARMKIETLKKLGHNGSGWRCYLPTNEVLSEIREQLKKIPDMYERLSRVTEMLNCCEINGDHKALLEVLKYVAESHRNEIPQFQLGFIEGVVRIFETMTLNEEHWSVLNDIVLRMYIKSEISNFRSISITFLQKAFHFRFSHRLSTDFILEMMFYVASCGYHSNWNFFMVHPEYERQCLIEFFRLAQVQRDAQSKRWSEIQEVTVLGLIRSIYEFNERPVKDSETPREPIEYQWLFDELEKMIEKGGHIYCVRDIIKKLKPEMHDRLWPPQPLPPVIEQIDFSKLKKNPESVLLEWEKYFDECERSWGRFSFSGEVYKFLKSLRWYNELPKIFIERCVRGIFEEKRGKLLILLALLVDGDEFGEFVSTLLPTKTKIDVVEPNAREDFSVTHHIASGMKMANPPVSLELLKRLSEGDYLSSALTAFLNNCMRTRLPKAIEFAKYLASQRVSVAKHGVRLMSALADLEQLREFLSSFWTNQGHHTMRTVTFKASEELFRVVPNQANWSFLKTIISSITEKDTWFVGWPFNVRYVPDEYVADFMKTQLELIDRLDKTGNKHQTFGYLSSFLRSIDTFVCQLLPEDFLKELFERFLFDGNLSTVMRNLLISIYLAETGGKLNERLGTFSEIFKKAVKDKWNVQLEDSLVYSIRAHVHDLIKAIVVAQINPLVVECLMESFQTVLTHEDDSRSYLLLVYANEWIKSESPKEFSNRIALTLPKLIEIYTSWFVVEIAEILKDFLMRIHLSGLKRDDVIYVVVETLIDFGTIETAHTAVQLINSGPLQCISKHYRPLAEKLAKTNYPAVRSHVNMIL